jgi:hypothetical protein
VTTTLLVHPSIAKFRKGPKEATAGGADIGERRELELSGAAPAFRQAQGYWIDQKGIEFVPDCGLVFLDIREAGQTNLSQL